MAAAPAGPEEAGDAPGTIYTRSAPPGPGAGQPAASAGHWPLPGADAAADLRDWDGVWTVRLGYFAAGPEGREVARLRDGAWEIRSDVARLRGLPRFGASKNSAEALKVVHAHVWPAWKDARA